MRKDKNDSSFVNEFIKVRQFEAPEHFNYIGLDWGRRCFAFATGNLNATPAEKLWYLRCFSKNLNTQEVLEKVVEHGQRPELFAQNL